MNDAERAGRATYQGPQILTSDARAFMVGADFASGPDMNACAVRAGTKVVLTASSLGARIDAGWINRLRASRKDDRETLAMAFVAIANSYGAKVERRDKGRNPGFCGASIDLTMTCNGVGALVSINDLHGGDHALISWYIDTRETGRNVRTFTPRFNAAVREYSGRRHHKATTCGADWYSLAMCLDAGLMLAARGEAFTA